MNDPTQALTVDAKHALRAQERSARRFNLMMAAFALLLTAFDLVVARLAHVGTKDYFFGAFYSLALLAGARWYCRWRGLARLVDASELGIWAVVFTNVLSVVIQLAGRSPRPLVDGELAHLDVRMHFATAAAVAIAGRLPALRIPLALAYALTGPLILVAVLLPALLGCAHASRRYVLGIVLAAILTAAAFSIWPAAGPWTSEGYPPAREQAAVTAYLLQLKSTKPVELDMEDAGIVAFPSFHVLLAILTAAALSAIRWLRAPAWALSVLVGISTITTGWHYLVDVIGGIILSVISLAAARLLLPESDGAMPATLRDSGVD